MASEVGAEAAATEVWGLGEEAAATEEEVTVTEVWGELEEEAEVWGEEETAVTEEDVLVVLVVRLWVEPVAGGGAGGGAREIPAGSALFTSHTGSGLG